MSEVSIKMDKFLEEEVKAFEIVEQDEGESNAEKRNSRVRCWVGTWNNPSMTDEEFESYLQNLYDCEKLQYAIFQREQGEKTGIIHFQFFVNFRTPQYFKKLKEELLPKGSHFKPMISTAHRCKAYCSKVDTRVSGPYEIGEFEEERQRSDLAKATKMIDEGIPFEMVAKIFPNQCLMYSRQLKERQAMFKDEEFSECCRNLEVTYIYGKGGIGKTSLIYKKHGFKDVFMVSKYEKYLFEKYNYKKIVVFDEFASQIKITEMNRYLDIYPIELRGLGKTYPACYDKVYILSNLPPTKQYQNLNPEEVESYEPFLRRLHNIIYLDEKGIEHVEKKTIFRDLSQDEIKLDGLTRDIDKTIYYSREGKIIRIESKHKVEQVEMFELPLEADNNIPFNS